MENALATIILHIIKWELFSNFTLYKYFNPPSSPQMYKYIVQIM